MAILLLVGETWIRRSGRSPEWWDSWVITLWVRDIRSSYDGLTLLDMVGHRCVHT